MHCNDSAAFALQASEPARAPWHRPRSAARQDAPASAPPEVDPRTPYLAQQASRTAGPATVEQMQDIVAANLPVFYFHPKER